MVTTLAEDEPQEVETVKDRYVRFGREIIAGEERGAVRRIILYVLVAVALIALAGDGLFGLFFGGLGIIALLLLGMTDNLA